MTIRIPDYCIVLLFGGEDEVLAKFAATTFGGAVNLAGQGTTKAIEPPLADIERRLKNRKLVVVVIGPNVGQDLDNLLDLGDQYHARVIGLQFSGLQTASSDYFRKNKRPAIIYHLDLSARSKGGIPTVETVPLQSDRRTTIGRFDIIGDVHGCFYELVELLRLLGYRVHVRGKRSNRRIKVVTPADRRVIFVGDLVDRGPASPDVLRLIMEMVAQNDAMSVIGNHDNKLLRWLEGRKVSLTHGLETTVEQLMREQVEFRSSVRSFLNALPYQLWLDGGRLAIVHAGIRDDMVGRESKTIRDFCLFGDRSGGRDELGLPIRYHWALQYKGHPAIVYGHTPVSQASWVNNTLCIDTGCVFGGRLTALRWPERYVVSVPAQRVYRERSRPFGHPPPRPSAAPN